MIISTKRHLSSVKIIEMYKSGERNFSNIVCNGADFPKAKLSGCNFSGANLSYCTFDDADVSNCDFTHANLEWSSFKRSDMRNSNFTKVNLSWSVLNKAKLDNALLKDANVSWCLLFDVDIDKADKKNADFSNSAFHPSQVTKEGRMAVQRALAGKKESLPFNIYLELGFIVKTGNAEIEKQQINVEDRKSFYEIPTNVGYGLSGVAVNVIVTAPSAYGTKSPYEFVSSKKDAYKR